MAVNVGITRGTTQNLDWYADLASGSFAFLFLAKLHSEFIHCQGNLFSLSIIWTGVLYLHFMYHGNTNWLTFSRKLVNKSLYVILFSWYYLDVGKHFTWDGIIVWHVHSSILIWIMENRFHAPCVRWISSPSADWLNLSAATKVSVLWPCLFEWWLWRLGELSDFFLLVWIGCYGCMSG